MIERRRFGPSGPMLSCLALGTMRLPDIPVDQLSDLLVEFAELGITTHHSSHEYETDGRYLAALRVAGATQSFEHITKLAEPDWDHQTADPRRLRTVVERRVESIGAPVDVLQWLVRTADPSADTERAGLVADATDELAAELSRLTAEGLLRSVGVFGYGPLARAAQLSVGGVTGIVDYLGPLEPQLADTAATTPFVALRPLGGNRIAELPCSPAEAIGWTLTHRSVASCVVSMSSTAHAIELARAAGDESPMSGIGRET